MFFQQVEHISLRPLKPYKKAENLKIVQISKGITIRDYYVLISKGTTAMKISFEIKHKFITHLSIMWMFN